MRFLKILGLSLLVVALLAGPGRAATEITIQFPYAKAYNPVMTKLKAAFEKAHPQYTVKFRPAYKDYKDGIQTAMKQAVTKQLPDLTIQGILFQRSFVERGLAVDLSPFIEAEKDWAKRGYSPAMMSLSTFGGKQFGLAFAVSTPIVIFNLDLVEKAGGDPARLPADWDGLIALGKRIDALGRDTAGIFHTWNVSGNWMFQADVFARGGAMTSADEKQVAFDGPQGQAAVGLLARLVTEAKMPNLTLAGARQQFLSGKLGIWTYTTGMLGLADRYIKDRFKWGVAPYPVPGPKAKLPCGGNALIMLTKDPARQKGAWEFMKFATGPLGGTIMVKGTGYMPPNSAPAKDPRLLGGFYKTHPKFQVSLGQLPLMTQWYAFPGKNSLKIVSVINDHLQSIVDKSTAPDQALKAMAADVRALMPK